jgi:N-acetylglutamate synthase-like GNAT family acetyltransferase
MDVNIRPLTENDFEAVSKIQEAIMKKQPGEGLRRRMQDYIKKDPEANLVAETEGKVVGFVIGGIKDWEFGVEKSGWLEIIGIHPKYMGQGIGRMLGKRLLEHFKKKSIKNIYTVARWDSGDLLAFFKSIGFDRSDFINLERRLED